MTTRRIPRSRLVALLAVSLTSATLAACGASGPSAHTTTTLPPLPPSVFGVITVIGSGAAAGTGDGVERIQLSSVPPEILPRIRVGEFPDAVAIAPDGKTAYVTSYTANTVTPIDLATGKAGHPIAAGNGPAGIAITPDGKTAYVTDAGTSPIGHTVTPIDLVTGKAGGPITVGGGPQAIAITPDGKMAYVTNAGAIVTGQTGAIGNTVTPIDLATGRALPPITVGNAPIAIAISGGTAFVANQGSESVSTIDLATRTSGAAIALAGAPQSIAFSGEDAWVAVSKTSLPSANSLTPINLVSETAGTPVPVGSAPTSVAIENGTAWVVCSDSIVPVVLSARIRTRNPPLPCRAARTQLRSTSSGRDESVRSGRPTRHAEAVTDAAHRFDEVRVLLPELGPQAPHVDVDGTRPTEVVVPPDSGQQRFAGEHLARVRGEVAEQFVLHVREVERAIVDDSLVGLEVQRERAVDDDVGALRPTGSPQKV